MALNLASMFAQPPQAQPTVTTATPTTGLNLSSDAMTGDPYRFRQTVSAGITDPSAPWKMAAAPQYKWDLNALGLAGPNRELIPRSDGTGFTVVDSSASGDPALGTAYNYEVQNGKLVSTGSSGFDNKSGFVNKLGQIADVAAPVIGLGALGLIGGGMAGIGPFAGGAGAGAGTAGLSGMDLAADAAIGTGNNIATAGSALGGAGGIAGTGIPAYSQGAGYGQQVGGALADASGASPMTGAVNSAATNPALIDSALQTPGYGASSAGLGGGAGTGLAGMLSNAVNGIKTIPGASKVGGNIVGNLLSSALGGSSGGVSNLGNLGSLFTNYNQYSQNKDLINEIKGIYSPDGAYAKSLGEQLARKDAAAGRNSQYGPRLADLMGRLGDSQARALSGLSPMMQSQQGGLNGMVGAGSRLFDSMGGMNALAKLFQEPLTNDWALGPNGGPQMPTEDLDNWDLFGG